MASSAAARIDLVVHPLLETREWLAGCGWMRDRTRGELLAQRSRGRRLAPLEAEGCVCGGQVSRESRGRGGAGKAGGGGGGGGGRGRPPLSAARSRAPAARRPPRRPVCDRRALAARGRNPLPDGCTPRPTTSVLVSGLRPLGDPRLPPLRAPHRGPLCPPMNTNKREKRRKTKSTSSCWRSAIQRQEQSATLPRRASPPGCSALGQERYRLQ